MRWGRVECLKNILGQRGVWVLEKISPGWHIYIYITGQKTGKYPVLILIPAPHWSLPMANPMLL
jgi:hypothetical protein